MLAEFQAMSDGNLNQIHARKHKIKFPENTSKSFYSVPDLAEPSKRKIKNVEFDKMLSQKVIKPPRTVWTEGIVFAPTKDGTPHFCVDCWRLDALRKRDSK